MQYIATLRVKKTNVGIAGINLGNESCLRTAEKAFDRLGVKYDGVMWGDWAKQKNYRHSPEFLSIPDEQAMQVKLTLDAEVRAFLASI